MLMPPLCLGMDRLRGERPSIRLTVQGFAAVQDLIAVGAIIGLTLVTLVYIALADRA